MHPKAHAARQKSTAYSQGLGPQPWHQRLHQRFAVLRRWTGAKPAGQGCDAHESFLEACVAEGQIVVSVAVICQSVLAMPAWISSRSEPCFVQDLSKYDMPDDWELQSSFDAEPDPLDVILMVKEWTCSPALSQAPMVLLPKKLADALDPSTLRVLPKNPFSARQVQESGPYILLAGCSSQWPLWTNMYLYESWAAILLPQVLEDRGVC